MKYSTFVRWVMAFVFTVMSCAPSFACCKDAAPVAPAAATQSIESQCLNKAIGDCDCSKTQCGSQCDKCKNVTEVSEKITMTADEGTCTVGVDREICRIIYVPPSGPIRQCFKTHEDVKGTPSTDGKCCQVQVDGRQYCVQKGGSIYIPGLLPGDKGFVVKSLTVVTKPTKNSTLTVDGEPVTSFEKVILALPVCCSANTDRKPGEECTVQVTRQQCTWVGGSPGQPPQRVCWTTREDVKGKWSGNCCTVTVDGKQYCVQEGGGIYVPGIREGENVKSVTGPKYFNKFLTAPLNALKSLVRSVGRPFFKR
ncbi:MAG: hypothetical protein K2Y22_06315 [Candidatus Obscuribacterales bacterium]|nr:hypothetical protein [Candidatus Obscuribacterales bacterium]